jgi:predicted nuclease with TOPRIM domain
MKLGNEIIKNKFDDIDIKVDFLIELCQMLQVENLELSSKIKDLETKLVKKNETEELNLEQEALIQSKIDGLLTKLDSFSNNLSNDALKNEHQSNV